MTVESDGFRNENRGDFVWQGISDTTAVLWVFNETDYGYDSYGPLGIVVWGVIDSSSLAVPLSKLSASRTGYPTWGQLGPPSADQVKNEWKRLASSRRRAERKFAREPSPTVGGPEVISEEWPRTSSGGSMPRFELRREAESTDHFYRRVARFYEAAVPRTGKPTKALQDAAQVPKTTAARWVREARQRGFLALTGRGKART